MIDVDGSKKGGSGTILRSSIAFSAIVEQPLHIFNIRQNRPQPGLKSQHLEAVLTAAKLCDAELEGARIDSRELFFRPNKVRGGKMEARIGTAGSISMLLITVLPICANAETIVELHISKGGTDVSHAPPINYMQFVLLPVLKRMGLNVALTVNRYGYYPKGNGEVTAIIEPAKALKCFVLEDFGSMETIRGTSVCTFLAERRVAERQANAANQRLRESGYAADIQIINDESNSLQKGSSIVLWAETDKGVILGADAIGELKKPSEKVGEEAAEKLCKEIFAKSTVDVHLADLLIPYMALAEGKSSYFTRTISDHLDTNIWVAESILNVKFNIEKAKNLYRIRRVE